MTAKIIPFPPRGRAPEVPRPIEIQTGRFVGTRESLLAWGIADSDAFPRGRRRTGGQQPCTTRALRGGLFTVRVDDYERATAIHDRLTADGDMLAVAVETMLGALNELLSRSVRAALDREGFGELAEHVEAVADAAVRFAHRRPIEDSSRRSDGILNW